MNLVSLENSQLLDFWYAQLQQLYKMGCSFGRFAVDVSLTCAGTLPEAPHMVNHYSWWAQGRYLDN